VGGERRNTGAPFQPASSPRKREVKENEEMSSRYALNLYERMESGE